MVFQAENSVYYLFVHKKNYINPRKIVRVKVVLSCCSPHGVVLKMFTLAQRRPVDTEDNLILNILLILSFFLKAHDELLSIETILDSAVRFSLRVSMALENKSESVYH